MNNSDAFTAGQKRSGTALGRIARCEQVVIFTSPLTDIRMIVHYLVKRRLPFKVIEMSMGSSHERLRFRDLCKMTHWDLLPQIFIDGEFVGGLNEFFDHARISAQ